MSDVVRVPWTHRQVQALNLYQEMGYMHPYTCGWRDQHPEKEGILIATPSGWICPVCTYQQNWARAFTADPQVIESWKRDMDFAQRDG